MTRLAGMVQRRGAEVAYQLEGREDLPLIVLLHGLATDGRLWQPQMPALLERRRVARIDFTGHGASQPSDQPFDIADLAQDVLAVLDQIKADQADIAGISLGGMVAMALAGLAPRRVGSLIICNARATMPAPAAADWQKRVELVKQGGIAAITAATLERWILPGSDPAAREFAAQLIAATSAWGYIGCADAISRLDLASALPGLGMPAVFVAGALDLAAPAEVMREMALAAGGSFHCIDASAHLPNLEQSEAFTGVLTRWLDATS